MMENIVIEQLKEKIKTKYPDIYNSENFEELLNDYLMSNHRLLINSFKNILDTALVKQCKSIKELSEVCNITTSRIYSLIDQQAYRFIRVYIIKIKDKNTILELWESKILELNSRCHNCIRWVRKNYSMRCEYTIIKSLILDNNLKKIRSLGKQSEELIKNKVTEFERECIKTIDDAIILLNTDNNIIQNEYEIREGEDLILQIENIIRDVYGIDKEEIIENYDCMHKYSNGKLKLKEIEPNIYKCSDCGQKFELIKIK